MQHWKCGSRMTSGILSAFWFTYGPFPCAAFPVEGMLHAACVTVPLQMFLSQRFSACCILHGSSPHSCSFCAGHVSPYNSITLTLVSQESLFPGSPAAGRRLLWRWCFVSSLFSPSVKHLVLEGYFFLVAASAYSAATLGAVFLWTLKVPCTTNSADCLSINGCFPLPRLYSGNAGRLCLDVTRYFMDFLLGELSVIHESF